MVVGGSRRGRGEEEGESVFVSMTDLTVSFLFILLVLLAFFATQIQPDEVVPRSEHEALERELSDANRTIRWLEEAHATERQRIERLEQERRVLTDRLTEANRTITKLRVLVDALRAELAAATTTIDALSVQVADLQRDLMTMRSERDVALARVELLVERLEQERRVLNDRLTEANRTITELRVLVDALRAELAAATTTIDALSVQVADLRRNLMTMRSERDDALARVELLVERLEQERRVLNDRLTEANRTITEFRVLVDALRAELAAATTTIDALSVQVADLQRDLKSMRSERDDALARVELLDVQVEQLTQLLADCRIALERLRAQLARMQEPDSLAAYLDNASTAREALLLRLADRIRHRLPGIRVTVDTADGLIRFRADELFPRGRWRIRRGSLAERVSHAVGDALAETLPCYTLSRNPATAVSCEGAVAAIETIQIEGHTDDVGLSPELQEREQMRDNYDLSARRGAETLRVMTRKRPELRDFLNLRRQPVLSFAGYGETRPVNQADTEEARAQNRRIDIRFILQTPRDLLEVEEIRTRLTRPRADLPTVLDEPRP